MPISMGMASENPAPLPFKQDSPIAQYEIGNHKNFIYLVLDWETRKAAWVDPQTDLSRPLADLEAHGFELEWVLLTHTHFDHVAGLEPLLKAFPKLRFRVNPLDLHRLPERLTKSPNCVPTDEGQAFNVGRTRIQTFHTPGHSAGANTYWVESDAGFLLSGDTVFIRDCGRTDFPDGSNAQMFNTLQRYKKFPPTLTLLPGHHYAPECWSRLGDEFERSPPFQAKSVGDLAALP